MKKKELIMHVQMFEDMCFITMENGKEQTNKLMQLFKQAGIILHKYYWKSKFDETYIELLEPNIFDAFLFQLDVCGDQKTILNVLKYYKQIQKEYKHLDNCLYSPLIDKEIKRYATRVLSLSFE